MKSDYELMIIEGEKRGKSIEKISKQYGVPAFVLKTAKNKLDEDRKEFQVNLVEKSKKPLLTSRTLQLVIDIAIIYLVILLLGLMEGMLLV